MRVILDSKMTSKYWSLPAELPRVKNDRPYEVRKKNEAKLIKLWKLQGKACSSFNTLVDQKDYHMDHCHKTGFVRGIVHQRCNRRLGRFEGEWRTWQAEVQDMQAAANYVIRFQQNHPNACVTADKG